jgi:hypothetical protein
MNDIIPYDFDWEFYLNNNQDLLKAGLKTEEDAIKHWLNFGHNENRKYKPKIGIAISTYANENTKDIRIEIIKKSLDSYKNVNIPIILVNDGSTNKKHIELINSYDYIKVINNPINGSVAMAKNIAIRYFDENDFDFCIMMDDDMEIIDKKFYEYYYEAYKKSGVHHLCYQVQVHHPNAHVEKVNDFSLSKSDRTNGCLYTITKEMIKELGYLKILKYKYGHAHTGYTLRSIKFGYASGFFDIVDSSKYLRLIPESNVNSSVDEKCGEKMMENWKEVSLYHNTKYIPFENQEKILLAGPWVGEFGWELILWQGYIRKLSEKYEKTIIITRKSNEYLYKDFANEIISFEPDGGYSDCWNRINMKNSYEHIIKNIKYTHHIKPVDAYKYINYQFTCSDENAISHMNNTQKFIKYTEKSDKYFDIIIHSRNRNLSSCRNWNIENWTKLIQSLPKDLNIACVGLKKDSSYIEGTKDMRDISMKELVGLINNTKLVVGESSGILHLSALCGTTRLVWDLEKNRNRYLINWNPLNTETHFISVSEHSPFLPDYKIVENKIRNIL